jgi:hypothetical protein
MQRQQYFSQLFARATPILLVMFVSGVCSEGWNGTAEAASRREQLIPILGTTIENGHIVGTVIPLVLLFEERADRAGLQMVFRSGPGRFRRCPKRLLGRQLARRRAPPACQQTPGPSCWVSPFPG